MTLDALEDTPEGCTTHHLACPCREAAALAVMWTARIVLRGVSRTMWTADEVALNKALRAWKAMQNEKTTR